MYAIRSLGTGLYVAAVLGSIAWTEDIERALKYHKPKSAEFVVDFNNIPNSEVVFYGA